MKFYVSSLKGELGDVIDKTITHRDSVLLDKMDDHFELWAVADYILLEDLKVYVIPAVTYIYIPARKTYQSGQIVFFFYDKDGTELYYTGGCSLHDAIKEYCDMENIPNSEKQNVYINLIREDS